MLWFIVNGTRKSKREIRVNSVTFNEAETRASQINPQLRAAGWKLNDRTQVRVEVPVDGYDAEPWNGVTDYCLYDASGNVLAVVEAKRCSRNAREADEQLRHYVTEIAKKQPFAPFGFMANGHDIWFWEVGLVNPRLVAGFFTPTDLERLKFLRQNRRPLEATPINSSIVDRPYQHEAIRRLAEAFAANKRRALLVMATGTGKTRVSSTSRRGHGSATSRKSMRAGLQLRTDRIWTRTTTPIESRMNGTMHISTCWRAAFRG